MKPSNIIGQNIKKFREQKGIKQEVLAKQIGITKGRMSQIESGDCEELAINRINKIASTLDVDFFEIAGVHPQKKIGENNFGFTGLSDTHNISPELVKAIADELANRMSQ